MDDLLRSLREQHAKETNPNAQKALKEFVDALDALRQQQKGATVVQQLAASSEAVILDRLTFGDPAKADEKKKVIQAAVDGVLDGATQIKNRQADIKKENDKISTAKANLKKLLDDITNRTKELAAARDQVSKLQAATVAAAQSTAPDADYKTADCYYELAAANENLNTLIAAALDTTLKGILDEIEAEATAQGTIKTLLHQKTQLEDKQKELVEQRKLAGR